MFLELAPHGSLASLYGSGFLKSLDGKVFKQLLLDMAKCVQSIHELNICHRDLKSSNVLVMSTTPIITVKLADFGIARVMSEVKTNSTMIGGTLSYLAPEITQKAINEKGGLVQKVIATPQVDVYSFGCILWELHEKKLIFEQLAPLQIFQQKTQELEHKKSPVHIDENCSFKKIIEVCWEFLPDNRPTMKEIVEMLKQTEL